MVSGIIMAVLALVTAILRGLIPQMGDVVPVAAISLFGTIALGFIGGGALDIVKDKISRKVDK